MSNVLFMPHIDFIRLQNHSILDDSICILVVTVYLTEYLALNGLKWMVKILNRCKKVRFGHFFQDNRSTYNVFGKFSHINKLYDS